jgi:putative membrane protein
MIKKIMTIFLWVIHVAAIVGIALGYEDFFYPKTPLTMLYLMLMLALWFPVDHVKKLILFFLCVATGIGVEWIGVHTGWLFGSYSYLENFGVKLDGIPVLIGVNWGILVFITHEIARDLHTNIWLRAAVGALLMVFMDYFLEQICAHAGYWEFTNAAGWLNYACWFVIGYALQITASLFKLKGDKKIAINLYLVQTLFAATLWILITI